MLILKPKIIFFAHHSSQTKKRIILWIFSSLFWLSLTISKYFSISSSNSSLDFGVRQMPLDEFRRVYTNEQAKIQLERSPMQDTAEFCLKSANTKTTVSDKDLIDFKKLMIY